MSKLTIVPLALFQWGIIAWYLLYWDLFPKYSLRRLIPWILLLASAVGVPAVQALIYRRMASTNRVEGWFVPLTIIFESAVSVALALYILSKRRTEVGRNMK